MTKFQIGDKVRFNKKTPKFLSKKYTAKSYVVDNIIYNWANLRSMYGLRSRNGVILDLPLYSYELNKAR